MLLWKKLTDLMVTNKLLIGAGAKIVSHDRDGNECSVAIGATETRTSASTMTPEENGKTIFLSSATEFVTTLPKPKAGLKFTFIVAAAPSGASYTVVTNGSANIVKGMVLSADLNAANDGDIETSGGDTITFADGVAVAGDRVDLMCDGTNWFAYGMCTVYNAITITTAA